MVQSNELHERVIKSSSKTAIIFFFQKTSLASHETLSLACYQVPANVFSLIQSSLTFAPFCNCSLWCLEGGWWSALIFFPCMRCYADSKATHTVGIYSWANFTLYQAYRLTTESVSRGALELYYTSWGWPKPCQTYWCASGEKDCSLAKPQLSQFPCSLN